MDSTTLPTGDFGPETPNPDLAASSPVPERIGHYQIIRVIGEGGMGTVYEARQDSPDRTVALKVIRPGYLSPKLLRRFDHESQILGRLHHPGIAQVYEAGTVEDAAGNAVPFFAMEFVRGVDLATFASTRILSTRQRLALIARICDAVDHAHAKGVIHRDLKPANILIDEAGNPKILDFGVARATDSDIAQTTMHTDIGQLVGTVPYMSPEQVAGDPDALDTRSDVYALGVIAYELLAGKLPYDIERRMIHEAVRVIREVEPSRLSSADRSLRGDVETIIAKALEKDASRRYPSADALASDIRRYLSDEPISARPASTWYQLSKFARRNRALVGGVVAAFVILLAGIAATSWQAVAATRARDEAQANLARAEQAEADAEARAEELQQVADFQESMLAQINPTDAGVRLTEDVNRRFAEALEQAGISEDERDGRAKAFRQDWLRINATDAALELIDETILKPAVQAIDNRFVDQPTIDAQLRQAIADRYRNFGLYESAMPLQQASLDARRKHESADRSAILHSISNMGRLLHEMGRLEDAEAYYREAMEMSLRIHGGDHSDTLICINNMGALCEAQGKLSEAETYYREAMEKSRRVLGEDDPSTLLYVNNTGSSLRAQGHLSEAEPYYREALEKRRRVLGENHPDTLTSIHNVGFLLDAQGQLSEAEPYFREAMEKSRRIMGESHPETLVCINSMASVLEAQGKLVEAEIYYREVLEKSRRILGEDHPNTLAFTNNLGALLRNQGKLSETEPYYREVMEKSRRVLGEDHPNTIIFIHNMGFLLRLQGKLSEAEPYYLEVLERSRRVMGEDHPNTLIFISNTGDLLRAQGKHQAAIDLLAPAEPAIRTTFTGAHARRLTIFLTALGRARVGLEYDAEQFAIAEANLLEAHSVSASASGESHKETLGCAEILIEFYTSWHASEPDAGYDTKAAEWQAKFDAASAQD